MFLQSYSNRVTLWYKHLSVDKKSSGFNDVIAKLNAYLPSGDKEKNIIKTL